MMSFYYKHINFQEKKKAADKDVSRESLDIYLQDIKTKKLLSEEQVEKLIKALQKGSLSRSRLLQLFGWDKFGFQRQTLLIGKTDLFIDPSDKRLLSNLNQTEIEDRLNRLYTRGFIEQDQLVQLKEVMAEIDFKSGSMAKAKLVEHNLRLVIKIAGKYQGSGLPKEDLVSEGNFGLMKAADGYELNLGTKFSTYAVYWIKQAIMRALDNQGSTIRIPVHRMNQIRDYSKVVKHLREKGDTITADKIATIMGTSRETVKDLVYFSSTTAAQPRSLHDIVGQEADTMLVDLIADHYSIDPESEFYAQQMKHLANRLLKHIDSERNRQIVMMRFGFFDDKVKTLEEIGQHFGLTRERVRQIISRQIFKLRQKSRHKDSKTIWAGR